MKKHIIMLFAALSLGSAALSAQTVKAVEDGKYDIKVGDITMTVNAAQGGKIVSYRLGDKEVLSQTRFPNSFGSTFWTSPQSEWNWPPVAEYDRKAFKAEVNGNVLVLTGEKSERFGYRVR